MGIPYDPTKPAANDKPTNDQPIMQSNFSSIKTLIDVDHTDFANARYGTHLQVTFGSNNLPPATPVSPPVLFTFPAAASLPQLFFYSGNATQSSSQYVISGQGSVLVLGGIILKWGTYTIPNGSFTQPVTFTSAFPNNVYSLTITCSAFSGGNVPGDLLVNYSSLTTSGFTGQRINSPATSASYSYIAIGS